MTYEPVNVRMVDFGIRRPGYVNAFLENIKWSEVSRRFANAQINHSGEGLHERRLH